MGRFSVNLLNPRQQKSVLECILEWSLLRPAWQRDALRRIIAKGKLDDSDYMELVELCKQGKSAADTELKPIPLDKSTQEWGRLFHYFLSMM